MSTGTSGSDRDGDLRLDRLLREDAARDGYIADDGFTARVMGRLPAPRRRRSYSWLGPALGAVAAAGVACFSPAAAHLAAPFQAALNGHTLPLHSFLVFLPALALIYGAAWLAATDSA
ncbi:MAG: hypothetical protein P4L83_04295 [Nevskia sp.]|nr:hypothetical protein [Nevskia sp.]